MEFLVITITKVDAAQYTPARPETIPRPICALKSAGLRHSTVICKRLAFPDAKFLFRSIYCRRRENVFTLCARVLAINQRIAMKTKGIQDLKPMAVYMPFTKRVP